MWSARSERHKCNMNALCLCERSNEITKSSKWTSLQSLMDCSYFGMIIMISLAFMCWSKMWRRKAPYTFSGPNDATDSALAVRNSNHRGDWNALTSVRETLDYNYQCIHKRTGWQSTEATATPSNHINAIIPYSYASWGMLFVNYEEQEACHRN